jgi:type IV pilus assembly protein PilP
MTITPRMSTSTGRRRRLVTLALLTAITGAGGCGGEQDDLRQYIETVKARKTRDIEPIPQIKPHETFLYVEASRRDPFANVAKPKAISGEIGALIDPRRNREPLEEFPLDALRLVGTLRISGQDFALIRDPTGVVHRVTHGNYLGQNYGKITGIAETEVNLREIVPDGFGGYLERQALIAASQQK